MPNSSRPYRVLHLSDTLVGATGSDEDGVGAAASLRQVLADTRIIPAVDVIVVTGTSPTTAPRTAAGRSGRRWGRQPAHGRCHTST